MKSRLLLLFFVQILFLTTLYADITTGLVAHYEFENSTADSSGNGYNLTTGGTAGYETGAIGQAYNFNGVDNNLTFIGLPTSVDGTISFWIKSNNISTTEMYVSTGDGAVEGTARVFTFGTDIHLDASGGNGNVINSPATVDGTWHHVVMTFTGTTTTSYVDGVALVWDTDVAEDLNITQNLYIGHETPFGTLYSGSMDDARIYNRELNSSDVTELYNYEPPKLSLRAHGGALQFNNGRDNYIALPDMTFSGDITAEAWVNFKTQATQEYTRIVEIGTLFRPTISPTAQVFDGSSLSSAIQKDTWNHVAMSRDSSGNTKIYINGVLDGNSSAEAIVTGTISSSFIHRSSVSTDNQNAIEIDEVRIWNTVKTSAEINASMNQQLDGSETGLVAYYNFDERIGKNIVDVAGGDLNATIEGNVTRVNFLGDGLSFKAPNDGFNYAVSASSIDLSNQSLSWSAWAYKSATGILGCIGHGSGVTGDMAALYSNDTSFTFGFSSYDLSYVGTEDLTNQWIHWSGTYDATTTERKLYKNAKLVASGISSADYNATGQVYIGSMSDTSLPFNGSMAEVSIWNRALTQNDINKTMYSSLKGDETGLVGYWPLNEGTGTTAYDRSINVNSATITGFTEWTNFAPKILGDKLYTTGGLTTFNKLLLDNNTTTPTFAWDGTVPTSIDFNSTMGTFTHSATDVNESFSIAGNNSGTDYNVTVRTINYPTVAFVYLELNLTDVLLADHNITNIQVIGEDGNVENFNIPDVLNLTDGNHTYNVPVYYPDNNFSIRVDVNDTDYSQSYYYNFVDKHLYGSQDYNLSSDFKQEISLINSSFTIDANLSNYIADLDFHVDFSGNIDPLAYSALQGFISDSTGQFIENLPLQTATSIGTLAYDFNTTVKQYHKEQSVAVRLESSIANNSLLITPLLNENNASHNIGPTVIAANLVDINVSINEIGPISNILIYNLNGNLKSYALLKEEFNTSAVSFTLPVVSGDYSIQAIYRDGNISSYDNATSQWIDGSSTKPVFTIGASLALTVLDSNFTSILAATTLPTASMNNQDIYLVKNFEDMNLTFNAYDTFGSDINVSVEYNSSILEINSSFDPLTYITQAEYSSSYLILKSIQDVIGTTAVKVTFTNTNLLFTSSEFNITVAPYGTKVIAGWNLLSLPVSIDLNRTDLIDTFAHDTNIERLYKHNGRWSYWDSTAGYDTNMSMSKFSSLRSTDGFWLKAIADTDVIYNFEGNISDINSSQNVYHSGWHLMGFNEDHNITDIPTIVSENNVTGIDSVDYVYRYEYLNTGAHWEVYAPDADLEASIDATIERTEDNVSRYDGVWVYVRKVY